MAVRDSVDPQMQVGVGLPLIGVEDHRWSAAAVVVQLIMVEFGEHFVLEVVQQIRGEQPSGLPGVHESVQLVDQHRAMLLELGDHRLVQGVKLPGIHHEDQSTCDSLVRSVDRLGWAGVGWKLPPPACLVVVAEGGAAVEFGG